MQTLIEENTKSLPRNMAITWQMITRNEGDIENNIKTQQSVVIRHKQCLILMAFVSSATFRIRK
jgi:hypothetical protein